MLCDENKKLKREMEDLKMRTTEHELKTANLILGQAILGINYELGKRCLVRNVLNLDMPRWTTLGDT